MAKRNTPKKTPATKPAKKPTGKTVATLRHDEASRKNIPTAEYQSMIEREQQSPVRVAYERRNRDLDPQLVWRGKDEQDWSDLVVHAPPLYIQEKVHPKALVDDLPKHELGNIFLPGPAPNTVRCSDGKVLTVPNGWTLLPPGDAALTRRVKAAGDHWIVQEKKGRKVFSRGVWAPAATIERIRAELEVERSTQSFTKKREADARRREKAQAEYVEDFQQAIVEFLTFHPKHADLAERLARAVADHATPVGSGTVARTKRIPVEQRAEAAVIAWLRHQTTGYDGMLIPRIKGKRREIRRMLAQRSKQLLERYRRGEPVLDGCPLKIALTQNIDGLHQSAGSKDGLEIRGSLLEVERPT
jgi:hypothetical protein